MKKYLVFTSVLVLAACGGGSGGSKHVGTVTPEAVRSNALITNMVSEIGIVEGGSSSVTPGRVASSGSFDYKGNHYTSYKLDNVDMQIADWEDKYTFSIDDNGKIIGIKKVNDDDSKMMARTTDTEFDFVFKDGENQKTRRWKLESFANDVGLKYADISKLTGLGPWSADTDDLTTDGDNVNMPVIMGYKIKRIENTEDLGTKEIVFNGVAVGTVADHYDDAEGGEHDWHQLPIEDKTAQLKFNNGKETLKASFDNWYDIEVTKDGDNINFVYSNNDPERVIPAEYQFKAEHAGEISGEYAEWDSNYYGNNEEKKEVTTMFHYVQPYGAPENGAHTDVVLGFGGKEK